MDVVDPLRYRLAPRERALAFVEIVTVGLPFGAFKMLAGVTVARPSWIGVAAYSLIGLGGCDLLFNLANAITVVVVGRRVSPVCCLHAALSRRRAGRRPLGELGLALDTALSFALVAAMIGWSKLATLPKPLGALWNIAVVLNVLGAGALRVADALHARVPAENGQAIRGTRETD